MIRKFLVCSSNYVFLSAVRQDLDNEHHYIADILMPVEIYWDAKNLLQKADYLLANGAQQVEIKEIYKMVFKKLSPYASFEKDRHWLIHKAKH